MLTKLVQKTRRALSDTLTKEIQNNRIAEQIAIVNECERIPLKAIRAKTPPDVKGSSSSFELQVEIIEPVEPRKIEYRIDLKGWSSTEDDKSLLQVMKRAGKDLAKWENVVIRDSLLVAAGKSIVTREIGAAINELSRFIQENGYEPDKLLFHPSDAVRLTEAGMMTPPHFNPTFSQSKGSSFIGTVNDLDVHCMRDMKKGIAVIYDHHEVELIRTTPRVTFDNATSSRCMLILEQCAVLPTTAAVATADFGHSNQMPKTHTGMSP